MTQASRLHVPSGFCGLRWLSAAAMVLFAIQIATGVLLALYYYPEPEVAYRSVRYITEAVPSGWIVRGVHHWAGELFLAAILLHLLVVFVRRAYVYPREYNWVLGGVLAGVVLVSRFTGRLLPWDVYGFVSAKRGLEVLSDIPVAGSLVSSWLHGGEDMGANTLARFFVTHVLIAPWFVLVLMLLHTWLVRRYGLKESDR